MVHHNNQNSGGAMAADMISSRKDNETSKSQFFDRLVKNPTLNGANI